MTNPPNRRRLLRWLGAWIGLAGFGLPSSPRAAGKCRSEGEQSRPVEVSLMGIAPGTSVEVEWQGRPVFVRRRTAAEIARERAVPLEHLRDPERDEDRARRPEWVVVEGICTHGGCTPTGPLGDFGGWYCLCHGSQFDTAGRVRAGPARENLTIPPHEFDGDRVLRVGCAHGTTRGGVECAPGSRTGAGPGAFAPGEFAAVAHRHGVTHSMAQLIRWKNTRH